jgi:hypothetical protein
VALPGKQAANRENKPLNANELSQAAELLSHRSRRKVNCMGDKSTKVLGYVAVLPGTINVLCDGDSCIVAGSEKLMRDYIASFCRARIAEY